MGKISPELRTRPVHVGVVMKGGAMTGDDIPLLNIWPTCDVPDPPSSEEDATMALTIRATSPINMLIHKNAENMMH